MAGALTSLTQLYLLDSRGLTFGFCSNRRVQFLTRLKILEATMLLTQQSAYSMLILAIALAISIEPIISRNEVTILKRCTLSPWQQYTISHVTSSKLAHRDSTAVIQTAGSWCDRHLSTVHQNSRIGKSMPRIVSSLVLDGTNRFALNSHQ